MDSLTVLSIVIPILVIVAFLIIRTLRVIPEYQRGISFRFGHLRSELKPGINLVVPLIDSLQRVDMRVITLTIPPQEVITKDNVPARVNAVVLFRVISAKDAVLEVENYPIATSQIAQTTLRSLLGRVDLDTLLAHRDDLNADLQSIIDSRTRPWGIKVELVEIKDIEIPEAMQRAMAREAEAERERRAKIISARGELEASSQLKEASDILSDSPASLQLRYLQTLLELGADQNSTVVFPLPLDIVGPLMGALKGASHEEKSQQPSINITEISGTVLSHRLGEYSLFRIFL